MSRPVVRVTATVQPSPADRWISRAAAATVAALAGLAGAISYSHMQQLAQEHGQTGWHAQAFPLSVDGLELVASLVLLGDRRHERRSGWLPWAALIIGTLGSLTANIATAHPDLVSRVIAGWPALALLTSVKLLSGMLEHRSVESGPAAVRPPGPVSGLTGASLDAGVNTQPPIVIPPSAAASSRRSRSSSPLHLATRRQSAAQRTTLPGLDPQDAAMLGAVRAARDELHRDGHPLTRDALAARLRQHGHPIRNARLTPLLQLLRHEESCGRPPGTHARSRPTADPLTPG